MTQPDPSAVLSQFLGSLPTFVAVLLAWMHSNARITDLKTSVDRRIDDMRDMLRAEFRRVEEVMDARLKHLEEREH
jgi:hypothetical protein